MHARDWLHLVLALGVQSKNPATMGMDIELNIGSVCLSHGCSAALMLTCHTQLQLALLQSYISRNICHNWIFILDAQDGVGSEYDLGF